MQRGAWNRDDIETARRLWSDGVCNRDIAEIVGRPIEQVRELVQSEPVKVREVKEYIPTPEDIRQACDAIQQEWNGDERRRRCNPTFRTKTSMPLAAKLHRRFEEPEGSGIL